jgi:capsular polysaccharide biosynthesis protein
MHSSSIGDIADHQQFGRAPDLFWLLSRIRAERIKLVAFPLLAGSIALGLSFLIDNIYTSSAVILPPQQQQSSAASALANLGALAGAAGGIGSALKTPADQYAALLQSANIESRIIDKFDLMKVYQIELRSVTRKRLQSNVRINVGKKDGLIYIEVDDKMPQRAADIANTYVTEETDRGSSAH